RDRGRPLHKPGEEGEITDVVDHTWNSTTLCMDGLDGLGGEEVCASTCGSQPVCDVLCGLTGIEGHQAPANRQALQEGGDVGQPVDEGLLPDQDQDEGCVLGFLVDVEQHP